MYSNYARAAAEIAREAGQFLKHFSDGHRLDVERKGGDLDFVTNADRGSQRLIADRLRERFPEHHFIGEEDGVPDSEIARRIAGGGDADFFWICDPLDGTVNYIHHLGVYAVSLGLVHRGASVAGAICVPEADEVFTAARGEGAYLNGKPIRASKCDRLARAFTATDIPVTDMDMRKRYVDWFSGVSLGSAGLRMPGSACTALALVADGRLDAYWNLGAHPWDVAAGMVLVEEAGGCVTDMFSGPFDFGMAGGVLACAPGLEGAFREAIHG